MDDTDINLNNENENLNILNYIPIIKTELELPNEERLLTDSK